MLSALELTGRARTHVREFVIDEATRFVAHDKAGEAFMHMRAAAARHGIDLVPLSAFRDFAGQMKIWTAKWNGERPLYDADGGVIPHGALDEDGLVDAILSWSALPGASRHHWGSEFDVIDRAALPDGYRPRLLPDEYVAGGPFARLGEWLHTGPIEFGFFRPYDIERGGLHPEPWHLSWAPLAVPALGALTPELMREAIEAASDMPGRERVLARIEHIHTVQVCRVGAPAWPV
ncbi:M15 family metallopeptidase [Uliginosibacterium sp. sgz301328]|uniref:M15 family metallopeptidase n=1 Tax=Uliginosibacterium sp. sgz301328 TaxID=3243764 RepID=UPI00359D6953